jgi:hypothetical protein
VVRTTARPLYPREDPVPIVQEAGWAAGSVWTCAKNLGPPTGIRSPDHPACSQSLYRLSYPGPTPYQDWDKLIHDDDDDDDDNDNNNNNTP